MSRHFAPAAERNRDPILEVIRQELPGTGRILEIASGSGQHVVHFAAALPDLVWQPTDFEVDNLGSIRAWIEHEGLTNVLEPRRLDVRSPSWPVAKADGIVCINMIHISPWECTVALLRGAARVLPDGAPLCLYGPYRIDGRHTAPSNAEFDASLRARDPGWGVRDLAEVEGVGEIHGWVRTRLQPMPANNFCVVFRRDRARSV